MSFLLTALFFALVVGTLRALALAADRPDPLARAATPQASSRPGPVVPERRAAWPLASRARLGQRHGRRSKFLQVFGRRVGYSCVLEISQGRVR